MNAAAGRKAASGAEPFPWAEVMHLGLGLLRLSPKTFWAMTPLEFAHAAGFGPGRMRQAPSRAELAALMRASPDAR